MRLLLICIGLLAFQASADLVPLASDAALKPWSRKSNTELARNPDGSLAMTVRAEEFSFGWAQCPLAAADIPARAAGVYGRARVARGTRAQLGFTLILPNGKDPIYYTCPLSTLAADGEWVEFYASLPEFRPERNARESILKAAMLQPGTRLQINLSGLAATSAATTTFDRLRILPADEAETVGRAVKRATLARALLPESACAGAPHPRLLMNPERLARVRATRDGGGDARVAYDALLKHADGYLRSIDAERPLPGILDFEPDADRTPHQQRGQFEGRFTAAVIPIEILAAAYQITGDERYGRHAARALVNAARTLDADHAALNSGFYYTRTFYVRALAFGYDWLWHLLTPDERRDVKTTLLGFVTRIHADSWSANWGRRPLHRVWNWDPGLVSCAGLGMLALEGETAAAEKAILFDLRRHLRDFLTLGIDADGAGHEGPRYLAYGIGAGPEFAECLREQGRGDLFTETNWQLIAPWIVAETLPDRMRWNNLSDSSYGQSAGSVYSYTCGRLASLARADTAAPPLPPLTVPSFLAPEDFLRQFAEAPGPRKFSYATLASLMGWYWDGSPSRRIATHDAPSLLAYLLFHESCAATPDPSTILPDGMIFRGRGLVVSRTGYGSNDLHFAVEAGPHVAGHDQSDKSSFTLYGYGADLAIDSGYGNDGEALKSGSSHAHNMVLIDGQGQPMNWHNQSSGAISGYHHSPLLDWIRVDAREAWNVRYDSDWVPQPTAAPVKKAVRQFLFVRGHGAIPPYLVVMDDIRKDGQPADYTWLWHIPADMRFRCQSDRWQSVPVTVAETVLTTAPDRPQGGARFTLRAPADGRYALAALTRAGGADRGKSDSFHISVNGGRRETWHMQSGAAFGWERIACLSNSIPLKKGESLRVDLTAREPEAQLAKLALIPDSMDASSLPPPDELPAGSVTLTANDAEPLKPALLLQAAAQTTRSDGRLTVFPVTTDARLVTNRWYETSREGMHPRLEHTVRAIEPRFLMVLVPGTPATPLPRVKRLAVNGGVGAEIAWGAATDRIVFGAGNTLTADGLETDGHAAFIRQESGAAKAWMLLDGTTLSAGGTQLMAPSAKRVIQENSK